jgi:hypothetical protein
MNPTGLNREVTQIAALASWPPLLQAGRNYMIEFEANTNDNSLLMATMTGRRSFAYWMEKVVTPSDWSDYFNANAAINYANIRFWVSSSIQGALLAATRNRNNDKSQNVSIDPAHALAAGLAVSAGRVMLGFVQRRTKIYFENAKLHLEKLNDLKRIGNFNNKQDKDSVGDSGRWKPKPKPTANCKLGRGRDWGCCANYPGCCHFWHEACWYHDLACIFCSPRILCGGPFCQTG